MPGRRRGSVPKQERSRFLVDAVLEAAERVMASSASKATMGTIAKVAGVSVGSLYRYFPARDALLAAVVDRRIEGDKEAFRAALAKSEGETLEQTLRTFGRAVLADPQLTDPQLLHYLVDVLESVERLGRVRETFDGLTAEIAAFLHERHPELGPLERLERRCHILFWAMRAAYLARIRVERPLDIERLQEDAFELSLAFLSPPDEVGQAGDHGEG